ncbi:hypothetical protein DCAR_0518531 [Daucus carota subsp. sativus]|uniref:DUF2828 domain-containing protein n=1 Tax=Daucus carota subsp. sativus TaxID=79200 RepID=A0A161ZZX8_DAUCS|nr:hypothetical protein DCAR_0518531 [Daucus carota subsp. sativus]
MGASQQDSIRYNRVTSIAMTNYKQKFLRHDRLRFDKYVEKKVRSAKATLAYGALLPHKIIASLDDKDLGMVAELQGQGIVDDLSSNVKLKNCIAICDISSSMKVVYMDMDKVEGEDLRSTVDFVRGLEVESATDFQKVFHVILKVDEEHLDRPQPLPSSNVGLSQGGSIVRLHLGLDF